VYSEVVILKVYRHIYEVFYNHKIKLIMMGKLSAALSSVSGIIAIVFIALWSNSNSTGYLGKPDWMPNLFVWHPG